MDLNTPDLEKPNHSTSSLTPAMPPIIEQHWLRDDQPSSFAEQAAAAAFGRRWATPSERAFVDHPPPVLTEPKPAPVSRNPVSAILLRKRRAA